MLELYFQQKKNFPLLRKNKDGLFSRTSLSTYFPIVHPDFIKEGLDISLMTPALRNEIEKGLNDDIRYLDLHLDSSTYLEYSLGDFIIKGDCIIFPKVISGPYRWNVERHVIEPFEISPNGSGSSYGIYIEEENHVFHNLDSSNLTPEFIEEYEGSFSQNLKVVGFKRGWFSHNLDQRDLLYRNIIFALNNAHVKRKYN